MKVTIEGTKSEIMELLAEIRKKEKEYITVPNLHTTPLPTKSPWYYDSVTTTVVEGREP